MDVTATAEAELTALDRIPETWIPMGLTLCNVSDGWRHATARVARTPRTLEVAVEGSPRLSISLVAEGDTLRRLGPPKAVSSASDRWAVERQADGVFLERGDGLGRVVLRCPHAGRLTGEVCLNDATYTLKFIH